MRWLLVAIVAYVLVVVQTAVFRPGGLAVPVHGYWARPDLVLVLAVFVALYFAPAETFVVTWCLGLAGDLVSVSGRLGVQALLYAGLLTGLGRARRSVNRGWVLTQSALVFGAVLVIHLGWSLATQYLAGAPVAVLRPLGEAALDAAYSAVLAPYLWWLLLRLRGPLGVRVEPYEA